MFKKSLALFMAILVCCTTGVTAFASGYNVQSLPEGIPSIDPYFTDQFTYDEGSPRATGLILNTYLSIKSNATGSLTVVAEMDAVETLPKIGFTYLIIQHWDGTEWVDLSEITDCYYEDTDTFIFEFTRVGFTSGDFYRIKCNFYAKKNWLTVEKEAITSSYITCR